jgi:hypothetical protein
MSVKIFGLYVLGNRTSQQRLWARHVETWLAFFKGLRLEFREQLEGKYSSDIDIIIESISTM